VAGVGGGFAAVAARGVADEAGARQHQHEQDEEEQQQAAAAAGVVMVPPPQQQDQQDDEGSSSDEEAAVAADAAGGGGKRPPSATPLSKEKLRGAKVNRWVGVSVRAGGVVAQQPAWRHCTCWRHLVCPDREHSTPENSVMIFTAAAATTAGLSKSPAAVVGVSHLVGGGGQYTITSQLSSCPAIGPYQDSQHCCAYPRCCAVWCAHPHPAC
jgi:hypothetical protein